MKSILIDESLHKRLSDLAKDNNTTIKGFIGYAINYFHRSGRDPRDLIGTGPSKTLNGMKKQLDFLVRMLKTQETAYVRPMAEAMLSLESGFAKLDTLNELSKTVSKTATKFPGIGGLNCPMCEVLWRELKLEEDEIRCPDCEFYLPLSVGNLVFSKLDIYTLLYGGVTKVYTGFEYEGKKQGPLRFKLHESGRIRMVREGRG